MKTRSIIKNDDSGKAVHASRFEVAQHIILRNGWEYYLEEEDSYKQAFGYVMGFHNEWGVVDLAELAPHIVSVAKGVALNDIMPPEGYYWEDEMVEFA